MAYDAPDTSSKGSSEFRKQGWKDHKKGTPKGGGHKSSSSSDGGFDSGMGIDETSILARSDVWNYKSKLNLFLLGSGDRDWNEEIFGIGAGGGLGLNFHKNFSAEADVRIRAWFNERPKDLPVRFLLNLKF